MPKFALGQSIQRLEDDTLLRGAGCYTDDVALDGALHAHIVRSPHAHARITSLSTDEARRVPGVAAILTGRDVAADGLGDMPCMVPVMNLDATPRKDTPRPILAKERVRHVGDPVAVVIAQTAAQARDAAEKVEVEYEPLAAVVDVRKGEVAFDIGLGGDRKKVDAAIARAAHVTRLELVNNRLVANPMEPRAALAEFDPKSGRTTLHTPSQGPGHLHGQIAETIVKTGPEALRVVSGNVGGAFGMKIFLHPEQPLMVWAATKLKRSVRWTAERGESFVSDNQGRDNYTIVELATDHDARFTALRVTTWANMGAYLSNFAPFIPQLAAPTLSGVYRIPEIHLHIQGTLTNTLPVDAYRGAGRPEATYLLERVIDAAARELGLAPDELRRRNFIAPSEMPFTTAVGERYDSGDFATVMARAMARADWSGFTERRKQSKAEGKLRGLGLAMYIERCGGGDPDTIAVRVDPKGSVNVFSGMQDNGQGHTTTLVQLASHHLGLDADRIRVVQGDTDLTPSGLTGGSRLLAIGGVALGIALDQVIEQGKEAAARRLEAAPSDIEYRDGAFHIAGTDRQIGLFEVGKLEGLHTHSPESSTYPNGCHICEVEVDPESGAARLVRYTIVDDFGRAMNPLLLEGQVHGGTVQGIGQALLEHTVYDDESGQLLSGSFMDYAIPRADDLPSLDCGFHHVPCTTNPLGVKGAGEAGAVGAPAAVVNAIVDALQVRHLDMPATPEKVWRAIAAR